MSPPYPTGAKRSKLDVVVDRLHLLPRNGSNGASDFNGTLDDDGVPF